MSESVWFKQVELGLVEELKKYVKYYDENGAKKPINRVMVRKPDEDFLDITGKDSDVELPCISIANTMSIPDRERLDSNSNLPVVVAYHGTTETVEDRAKPYKLYYQIDFWAGYEEDIDTMTLTWLASHPKFFDLAVVDNGGTPRKCYTTQNGIMQRSDSVVGSNRLFRATINYCIRVEIDENNRYNVNITKEIKSSISKM